MRVAHQCELVGGAGIATQTTANRPYGKEMEMLVNGRQGYDHYHAECDHRIPKADKRLYKKSAKRQEARNWRKEITSAY